ncbi:MAG: hypothetical protein MJE77_25435 [Proteobacteria bacterium]|nr:hypothetical protein [Pseudomonadota bacterium]
MDQARSAFTVLRSSGSPGVGTPTAALAVFFFGISSGCTPSPRPETGQARLDGPSVGKLLEIAFPHHPDTSDEVAIEAVSGWPLTISLTANEDRLCGISDLRVGLPDRALVFGEPNCRPFHGVPATSIPGRLKVLFTPGHTALPMPEGQANCPGSPLLLTYNTSGLNTRKQSLVPCVGSEPNELRYGRNHRLPGLVVVADTGPGIVFDLHFKRSHPIELRNLSGLFQSITYELKDNRAHTTIFAHMNVPFGLFAPVALVDECYQSPIRPCGEDEIRARVDGGAAMCASRDDFSPSTTPAPFSSRQVVTVRAFLVEGAAPDSLVDTDQNGIVDIRDAEKAGWKPMSGQAVFRFRQQGLFASNWLYYLFDYDGDRNAGCPIHGPGNPGGTTSPPR